ncbi:hypothetical protein [Thermococcus stetteri]|uniref:hypothetical protein n=1 Tax=Thermococcus stetteri TaxID=49900 RepID=UPI001AE63939|nr:hypothetical protein [Thermococcus stetteri]MBP1912523.1 hypothetical protein [Thermococcus stetteri]
MSRIQRVALFFAVIILVATVIAWWLTKDINITLAVLTLASTLATVMMAVTIYELDIAIKELNFEAVSEVYNMMDESLKEKLREISSWSTRNNDGNVLSVENFLKDNEKRKLVSDASITLNRVGYFVYRDFVGDWFIQEQYGGLILDSFLAMKPYLKALRDESECRTEEGDEEPMECINGPWFMRRFYLLLVVISYAYLCENFPDQCRAKFSKYHLSPENPVPVKWLHSEVVKWLKKRGYGKYLKS